MKKIIHSIACTTLVASALLSPDSFASRPLPGGGGGSTSIDLAPAIEWDKRAKIGERLTAHGSDLLGDSIDTHTGGISFKNTDISLPGNSDLEVALRRQLTQGYFTSYSEDREFGDWHLDIPRITVVTAKNVTSHTNKWRGSRCNNPRSTFAPVMYSNSTTTNLTNWVTPTQYSNGMLMNIPGQGSQHVLEKSSVLAQPFPSEAKFVTPQSWYLICGSANDGDGFVAIAPNGNRYYFSRYVQYDYRNFGAMTPDGGNAGPTRIVPRVQAMLLATTVTDVYGNWVKYDYDSSNRLTKIHANDGRSITLSYNGNVISSASANGRTWAYNYTTANISDVKADDYGYSKKILSSVALPDNTSWNFNLLAMHKRPSSGTHCKVSPGTMSLTHPNGVTGTYDIKELYHRNGYAEWMTEVTLRCSGAFTNPRQPTRYDIYHQPMETVSVTKKVISGNNIPTSEWIYTYEQDVEEERYPVGHQYEGHPIPTSGGDPTNWTKVLNPDGSEDVYYHYWNILEATGFEQSFGGKLARTEKKSSAGGTVLETQNYNYVKAGHYGGTYLPKIYTGMQDSNVLSPMSSGMSIQVGSVVTSRDGDTFTQELEYNTNQASATYSYGKPIKKTTYSSLAVPPRVIDTTYEKNSSKWILNLPKTLTVNGRLTYQYDYNSNGKLYRKYKYGTKVNEFTYYTSGTSASRTHTIKDALNNTTELLDWKRGTPQRIKRADGTNVYQYVDNNGWMTSSIDARGNSTSYTRDNMGRLTYVNYPGSWANTSIAYSGLSNGATQTITKGNSQIQVTYDSMFRPKLEKTKALDTGWTSYVNTEYDSSGRVAFKSLPSTSATETAGMDNEYDALGRIVSSTETVAPYAKTRHYYYSSHRHRIYDPSNAYTDYYSYSYDGPGNKDYRAIYHSSGSRINLTKNVWGELTAIRNWGTQNGYTVDQTNYYYYDSKRRVCRERNATIGDKVFQYDNADRLIAYQEGLSAGSSCTTPTGTNKVSLSYDSMNRVTLTNFTHSNTPDIYSGYDADGNVTSVNRGGINWTYSYNNLGNITSESLSVDGRTYNIGYAYDNNTSLSSQTYPTGRVVSFNPDGLGRPKYAKYGSTYYANSLQYHPTGVTKQFTYGNGHLYSLTLNNRTLPQRVLAYKGSNKPVDLTYSYDARGSITNINDASPSNHDLTLGYDAMNRLVSASGSWGNGHY